MAMRATESALELDDGDVESDSIFAEINITPFTDIVLVLLIIFMVSSSAMVDAARQSQIEIDLPAGGEGQNLNDPSKLVAVGVAADGRLVLDGVAIDETDLLAKLTERHKQAPTSMIVIDADGAVQHRTVVRLLDVIRNTGFTNVGIGTATDAGQ